MNIKVHTTPFHYIEIEDTFTEEEYNLIFSELEHHQQKNLFKSPDETGSASSSDNTLLKKNSGFFWDSLYADRNLSDVLKTNRKIFQFLCSPEMKKSWFFANLQTNIDTTLVSYYEDSDYYKPHKDKAIWTSLTYFYKEPKRFTGGNLLFTDHDIKIEIKKNLTIIFPSNIEHSVSPVKIPEKYLNQGYGRYVMSVFASTSL